MPQKSRKKSRRFAARIFDGVKLVFRALWGGIVFVWKRPVILSVILLIGAVFLAHELIAQAFADYWTCHQLFVVKRGFPEVFCTGIDIDTILFGRFTVGAVSFIDGPLEFARKIIVWTILVVFALVSLYLTLIVNNLKAVLRILVLNKEEWRRLVASIRTWLLIFVSFCLTFFYFYIHSILPKLK